MEKLTIAIVVPYFSGSIGSNEYGLAHFLAKKGHKVIIFSSNLKKGRLNVLDKEQRTRSNFDVVYLNTFSDLFGWPIVFGLEKALKKYDFDIIHAQEDYQHICYKALKYALKNKIPFIVSNERYYDPPFPKNIPYFFIDNLYARYVRKKADTITVHESAAKGYLIKKGVKKEIKVISVGVDISMFKPVKSNYLREKLKIKKNRKMGLCVARLVPYKNLERLILSMKNVPCELVIIGKGPLKNKLLNLIKNNNITNVHLITDFIDHSFMPKVYSSADFYIQPSIVEPFGIAVIEAMACGLPVIGSNVGGIRDTIPRKRGYYMNPFDTNNIKENIIKMIRGTKFSSKQIVNLIRSSYYWKRIVESYTLEYERLLK